MRGTPLKAISTCSRIHAHSHRTSPLQTAQYEVSMPFTADSSGNPQVGQRSPGVAMAASFALGKTVASRVRRSVATSSPRSVRSQSGTLSSAGSHRTEPSPVFRGSAVRGCR